MKDDSTVHVSAELTCCLIGEKGALHGHWYHLVGRSVPDCCGNAVNGARVRNKGGVNLEDLRCTIKLALWGEWRVCRQGIGRRVFLSESKQPGQRLTIMRVGNLFQQQQMYSVARLSVGSGEK